MKGPIPEVLFDQTRRRLCCVALVAVVFAQPLVLEAQQPLKIARIGYLSPSSATADYSYGEAFRQGLRTVGYIEGRNVVIETRYADGRLDRLRGLAGELVQLNVDVIVAAPTPAVRAAQQATRTTPIVMVSGDPVGEGLVVGLARPGGNITGYATAVAEITTKRVEFLKAIVPKLSHVAHLTAPDIARSTVTQTEAAGRSLALQVMTTMVRNSNEIDQAFSTMQQKHAGGVVVSLALREHWDQITDLARKSRLPTISGPREFAQAGGLMAYGPDYPDLFRRAATHVDKILKGAKPADLPIERPTKFEFVINLKTAKALGLTIPQSMLLQADLLVE
jgi:putative ABC transport system substrate-binding protein